ncbi:MAG TPA: hypothetical protein VNG31_05680 [Candidatus Baltobacteraceae bacterium]|nr:hypothetical protein [Candidatus Baltobacteraceae bacterium]
MSSVANAYAFLDLMMDKYATGSTIRLVQSFDGGGVGNFTDAVTYDDALTIDALLARGSADDLARAQVIGDAFLYAQAHDPARDGRLRAAYAPKPFLRPADVRVTDPTSDVGNMAWVGQSLVQLYFKTHKPTYLSGASEIATWILKHAYDKRGAGGYTGGYTASGMKIRWKSTEHNVDVYAFFSMLAKVTGPYAWLKHAAYAAAFVKAMWSPKRHRFFAGTGSDGVTPNRTFEPEDVNSWTYLAFADPAWASALDWNIEHLSVTAGGFSGVSFCSGDRSGVWFEGTAHLADALELRDDAGDATKARALLADVAYAQSYGPNGDGLGIIAASKNGLSDCDGDRYYASLHVGATAWYVMSASRVNPLQPLP